MKLSWLNDVQAPYREPMLRELSLLAQFEAFYYFHEEPVRHWTWRPHPDYRSSVVPAWRVPVPRSVVRRLGETPGMLRPGVVARILRGTDALVTQVWWQPANLWAILHCRLRGIPYLIYAESTMDSRSLSGGPADVVRRWVFGNAAAVIVPGLAAAEAAVANGTPPDRVIESCNSIDVDLYTRGVAELRVAGDEAGPHRFAYVGQLIPRKNVHSLVRAFATLDGAPTLEIAGDGVDQEGLRALAAELGVADRVSFLGFLEEPDILRLLARSHTLVLPSTEEVYGFTALEAHVAGLQVVVSDVAGIARTLTGRRGVRIVAPEVDPLHDALAEAQAAWTGWAHDIDVEFASPRRSAMDIVAAAEAACSVARGDGHTD